MQSGADQNGKRERVLELLEEEARGFFEGFREREHGLEALTSDIHAARQIFGEGVVVERASLDDILVLTGRGKR